MSTAQPFSALPKDPTALILLFKSCFLNPALAAHPEGEETSPPLLWDGAGQRWERGSHCGQRWSSTWSTRWAGTWDTPNPTRGFPRCAGPSPSPETTLCSPGATCSCPGLFHFPPQTAEEPWGAEVPFIALVIFRVVSVSQSPGLALGP